MLDDAVSRGVKIDDHVNDEAVKEMERLKAEVPILIMIEKFTIRIG